MIYSMYNKKQKSIPVQLLFETNVSVSERYGDISLFCFCP